MRAPSRSVFFCTTSLVWHFIIQTWYSVNTVYQRHWPLLVGPLYGSGLQMFAGLPVCFSRKRVKRAQICGLFTPHPKMSDKFFIATSALWSPCRASWLGGGTVCTFVKNMHPYMILYDSQQDTALENCKHPLAGEQTWSTKSWFGWRSTATSLAVATLL